jgi:sialate O-acetylesterase
MVLMKATDVPIWGKAAAGEQVSVRLATAESETKADSYGRWIIHLNLKDFGPGPYEMTIKGNNQIRLPM